MSVGVGVGKGFRVGTVARWASWGRGKALNVTPNGVAFTQEGRQDRTAPLVRQMQNQWDSAGGSLEVLEAGQEGRGTDIPSFLPLPSTQWGPGPLLGTGDLTVTQRDKIPRPCGPDVLVQETQ